MSPTPAPPLVGAGAPLPSPNGLVCAARVSADGAAAYASWLSRAAGAACRLPSCARWESAARGGVASDFAYGETLSTDLANYAPPCKQRQGPEPRRSRRGLPSEPLWSAYCPRHCQRRDVRLGGRKRRHVQGGLVTGWFMGPQRRPRALQPAAFHAARFSRLPPGFPDRP
ncbi:SUMF1/EgtB/PvdO family nonheme iron enzyme [Hyphomonas sp.]|uniref:SUMF1/EgtB/PvdO family nonheme iron enzyme n=1 Tax=Hyphomonas sp. TaxID=87 RepID=UPI0034A03C73